MNIIIKKLESGEQLGESERTKLLGYICELEERAKDGAYYRDSLTAEVLRLSAAVQPAVSRATMESVAKCMSLAQLREFRAAFEEKLDESLPPRPQLMPKKRNEKNARNGEFTI